MTVFLRDPDFALRLGDVRDELAAMTDGSVDCIVTSPPYWGLRDYGTGSWDGGDPGCDHVGVRSGDCRCGATRVDRQLGLEATPDEYVANMVAVFREVRRVLALHGTVWLNLGDSYAGKDLVGIPWRVAFALQADGWYLRSDVVWSKPNPMPESVTDRPTKSHEYVFLLSKQPRYWFDAEAVREPPTDNPGGAAFYARKGLPKPDYGRRLAKEGQPREGGNDGLANQVPPLGVGRNVRSVWEIATQPYAGAHFATFPEELVRRCLLAGCPTKVCRTCGKPSERIVERAAFQAGRDATTVGWTDCGHADWRPGVVLDPFMGSGTTALVARQHGRHAVGIELNEEYAALAAARLQQLSLLADASVIRYADGLDVDPADRRPSTPGDDPYQT